MDQWQGCTCNLVCLHKQIALSCLLFKYQFLLFSQALIQEHYLPAAVGYCNAKGYFVKFPPPGFLFDILKKWTKIHCYHSEKIVHHLFYMNVGNRAGIKEMSSLQYAQTSEWEGFPNKLLPKSRFRLAASTSGTSGKAGRSMTANAGSLEATLRAWNHTDAWTVDLCLGKTDRPEKVEVTC